MEETILKIIHEKHEESSTLAIKVEKGNLHMLEAAKIIYEALGQVINSMVEAKINP